MSCISWGLNVLTRDPWQLVSTRQQMYARNALARLDHDSGDDKPMEVRDTRRPQRNRDAT